METNPQVIRETLEQDQIKEDEYEPTSHQTNLKIIERKNTEVVQKIDRTLKNKYVY